MSFLEEQLKNKLKKGLTPTTTKITSVEGNISFYQNQGQIRQNLEKSENLEKNEKSYGFVVDLKPDLTYGQVLPWLYISSQDVPNDYALIVQLKITHIISLLPGFQLNPLVASHIVQNHLVLEVYDEESFNFSKKEDNVFKEALEFIEKGRKLNNSKILVHCNQGVSRAPSFAIYYLMTQESFSFKNAFEKVKEGRPQAKPNAGFIKQLKSLLEK